MNDTEERREDPRLRYFWPLWFGYEENAEFHRAKIIDLNSHHISFSTNEENTPQLGQSILTRFSYPLHTPYSFDMGTYFSWAETVRIDKSNDSYCKVAVRLSRSLSHQLFAPERGEWASLTA